MQDPRQIWEFGRWIARRESAPVRLSWSDGEVVLGMRQGRIHSIRGLDSEELSRRLACTGTWEDDLLAEARAIRGSHNIPEAKIMGTVKEILQEALRDWLIDPERELVVEDGEPVEADGPTISITHALVELVLADTTHKIAHRILPDRKVSLQRSKGFIELYAPLRLSEEADLIIAGITGVATADSVARASTHQPDEVLRLLAALVATGVLDPGEPTAPVDDLEWPSADLDVEEATRHRLPLWLIGALAALLLVLVIAVSVWMMSRDGGSPGSQVVEVGDWGVVVEMGCEPQDLQRMLRKRSAERKSLRTVKADPANGDACFRLVWGSFTTRAAAEAAIHDVPTNLIEEGFQPHVIEVPADDAASEPDIGD